MLRYRRRTISFIAIVGAGILTSGLWSTAALAQAGQPQRGAILRVALVGEPPSLDAHSTTAAITQQITWHIYEGLYTFDARFQPIPQLADRHEILDGGKRYVFHLRKGVRFQDGKEMGSADVVASLDRWGRMTPAGRAIFKTIEGVQAKDVSTVEVRFREPSGVLITALADPNLNAVIYPKEVIEAAGEGQVKQYIGTGPFKFVEHKPDRHIRLARFDGYVPRPEPPNGYGGQRTALLDEILFIPVPDVAVRLAGLQTGEYHFAERIKPDQYDRILTMSGLDPLVTKPFNWVMAVFNKKAGLFTDKRLRQAFLAALDVEPIMTAAYGHKDFYRLGPWLAFPEQAWWSNVGADQYNQRDTAKAQRLLKETGYRGQPIRWMTTQEYDWMYKIALVAKAQLEKAGFNIDLQMMDWATLVQRRNKPEVWDVFVAGIQIVPEPALGVVIQCTWPGWWCHQEKDALLQAMMREPDFKKRYALWERVQAVFWEDVPVVKFGDSFLLNVKRKELKGFRTTPHIYFWNAWLEK